MMRQLNELPTIDVQVHGPLSLGASDLGEVRVVAFESGAFSGPDIQGRLLAGGTDWQTVRPDGSYIGVGERTRSDVRITT